MGQQTPTFSPRRRAYLAAFDMRASSNANTSPVKIPAGPSEQDLPLPFSLIIATPHQQVSFTSLAAFCFSTPAILSTDYSTPAILSARTVDEHAVGCRVPHLLLRRLPCICCCTRPQHVHYLHQEQMQHSSESSEPCRHLHLYMLTRESAVHIKTSR